MHTFKCANCGTVQYASAETLEGSPCIRCYARRVVRIDSRDEMLATVSKIPEPEELRLLNEMLAEESLLSEVKRLRIIEKLLLEGKLFGLHVDEAIVLIRAHATE